MSVEDVDRKLATAVGKLDEAAEKITTATLSCSEGRDALGYALTGATDPEALEALGLQETAADQLDEARAKVAAIRERIEQYRRSIGAGASSAAGSAPPEPERPAAPKRPPNVVGVDGSEYPAAAAWAVDEGLPPRVQRGAGSPTVGYVRVNGLPTRVQSGADGFSDMVDQRLQEIGVRRPLDLRRHVEMKVAAMMTRTGDQHQEVVINHAPCGSEPGQTRGAMTCLNRSCHGGTR
ncbi:DddA-like double-stranded DNA deaminase toxin [Saccharopolyspora spinosa]|uniref:Nucleic acid/nucleotide deaminase of polymorphic system toxin n=1 Tax=Saccharopolyspora spinosa TaxID=60894 RepID=A0A2N3XXD0_SACSN|nr:DddA-like double-stranded DNA deaminase toxin [Saccharopolyspora spinosa]PKW15324.1 nucleic acid/nucleotide deaminase of polymorphic system toxin [Saccharopolyspora spinosa]